MSLLFYSPRQWRVLQDFAVISRGQMMIARTDGPYGNVPFTQAVPTTDAGGNALAEEQVEAQVADYLAHYPDAEPLGRGEFSHSRAVPLAA